ncbi:MAG: ABC-2 type transport system permease protein [Cyclobacteriaceae bacterium]|jgi:ABC-2 type transport system permease protein
MNNIGLIITREYVSRVRKRSFIIMTILGPLLFAGFVFIIGWTATKGVDLKTIHIINESGLFEDVFEDSDGADYVNSSLSLDEGKQEVQNGVFDGLLYIPKIDLDNPEGVVFYAPNNPSIALVQSLRKKMNKEIELVKLKKSGIDQMILDDLKSDLSINTINLSGEGDEKESSSVAATAIGYVSGFLIYMFIFIYGAMCMRGVVEEKTSRIIEVIIASVKPFHLMLGKVLGIAGVGLTQFLLWVILTFGIISIGGSVMAVTMMDSQKQQAEQLGLPQNEVTVAMQDNVFSEITTAIGSINLPMVLIAFLFFFISGYLLYGALFAAIGSAVDSDADTQQFMFPVVMPLIISISMLGIVINDPNGSVAFWLSIIPFTSPVIMMMRVPFGVPIWELCLSMALMIAGFIFTIWMASRIYRIGILLHGSKVNYKVLAKWIMMRN